MKHSNNYIIKLLSVFGSYGKVLLLLGMLTVACGNAWGDWYLWGYNKEAVSDLNNDVYLSNITLTYNSVTNDYRGTFTIQNGATPFIINTASKSDGSSAYNSDRWDPGNENDGWYKASGNVYLSDRANYGGYTMFKAWNGTGTSKSVTLIISKNKVDDKFPMSIVDASSPTPSTRAPSIYIGKKPTVSGNTATINLQLSDWGCENVNKVKIYYTTNGTAPTTSSSYWEVTLDSEKSSNANFDVVKSGLSTGTYNIKVAAHNSEGYGELSDLATFTILCSPPSFSSQPASETTQTQCKGVAFSAIEVSVSGTAESYQWQASDAADGEYANVTDGTGGTTASFIPSSSTLGTRYYKCVVTGCGTTITTANPVACTVNGITVTTVPATTNIHAYEPVTLTSSANVTWDIATVPGGVTKGTEAFLVDGSYGTAGSFVGLNTVVFKGKAGDGYKISATAMNNCYEDIDFNVSSDSETCP